jgi:hypothetical protein
LVRERLKTVAVVSAAVWCALAAAGSAGAAAPTRIERWVAFSTGKLDPGVRIVARGRGSCFAGSLADPRSDAWRCLLGNAVQDPCFSNGGTFLICPDGTPDSRDALQLRLAKPLPHGKANEPGDPTRKDPWVIVTAGGAFCYRATGTTMSLLHSKITYECAGASLLAGGPNRTSAVWTIGLLPTGASTRYVSVAIKQAWW